MRQSRYSASETAMMFADEAHQLEDQELFIKNLGWLLSQTREGVHKCEMSKDGNTVTIIYNSGATKEVNIRHDSYMAIIRDVAKEIG